MAVDLHTGDNTALPSQLLPDEDDYVLSDNDKNNNNDDNHGSALKPPPHSTQVHKDDHKDDDFIAELTHHMAHFMLQDDDTLDFSAIGSQTQNLELSWDLTGSPQSTLWSPMGCNQGSPEGSSQEPSPPATPGKGQEHSCWKTTYDVVGMFENMKLNERGNSRYHPGYEINHSSKSSNIGVCSSQSLIQEQIQAIELSRLKQEQVMSPKQKSVAAYRKGQGQMISQQYSEPKQKIDQQFQMKGKGGGGNGNGRRTRPPRPTAPQTGSGMRALFLGGSGSRGGTGVFLPRGAPSASTNKQGKGCSTVLIPARVVQALQLHFDKTAAMSGPKVVGFPPLHDLLVSNRDGMYSLQKRQSTKRPAEVQNEMILPREWTY